MKYSQTIGCLAAILVIASCFLPWIEVPTLSKTFNGIEGKVSTNLTFGKQYIMHSFLCGLSIIFFNIKSINIKRTNILITLINLSWAIKNYIVFSMCRPECPIIKIGLPLVLIFSAISFIMSLLPKFTVKT